MNAGSGKCKAGMWVQALTLQISGLSWCASSISGALQTQGNNPKRGARLGLPALYRLWMSQGFRERGYVWLLKTEMAVPKFLTSKPRRERLRGAWVQPSRAHHPGLTVGDTTQVSSTSAESWWWGPSSKQELAREVWIRMLQRGRFSSYFQFWKSAFVLNHK